MKLKEAIAAKAREQGIPTMAVMAGQPKQRGRPMRSTDEEIYAAWKAGNPMYAITSRICHCSKSRIKRVILEHEGEEEREMEQSIKPKKKERLIVGWGANARYLEVHYFREDTGLPLCQTKKRGKTRATIPLSKWNPNNPSTCSKCRKLYAKILEQEHGQTGDGIQKESQ